MTLFHRVDDTHAILRRKGVYYQAPLYTRDGRIYARVGGGFVLLLRNNNSTHPDISWEEISDPVNAITWQPNKEPELAAPSEPMRIGWRAQAEGGGDVAK